MQDLEKLIESVSSESDSPTPRTSIWRSAVSSWAFALSTVGLVVVVITTFERLSWLKSVTYSFAGALGLAAGVAQAIYASRTRAKLEKQFKESYKSVVLSVGEEQLKDYKHARRVDEIQQRLEFERNLKSAFCITHFGCEQVAMYENVDWDFEPGMNVLLGRNGYGKSHLIRALLSILQRNDEKSAEFFEPDARSGILRVSVRRDDKESDIICNADGFQESIGKIPVLAIPDARLINQANESLGPVSDKWNDLRIHSAHHFLHQLPYESIINTFLYQLCIDYGYNRSSFELPVFDLVSKVIENLTAQTFSFASIAPLGNGRFRMEVITEGESKRPLPIQKASQGTLSVVAIFGIIYYYLRAVFPDIALKDIFQQRALVVIDEIDAHLHPSWQRKVLGLLRKNFPNIQFIVTAHSPLVVGGCLENEVTVLRKASEERFTLFQFSHDFVGRELEEIYREVFEIEGLDDAYSHFIALSPQKDEIRRNLERLEAGQDAGAAEGEDITQLRRQLHYIAKVDQKQEDRIAYEDLKRENEMLKAENKKLASIAAKVEPPKDLT